MIKLKSGKRTCGCEARQAQLQLEPDVIQESLHLVDSEDRQVGQVDYIRGLESHPNRGTDPAIRDAIRAIRQTNTRLPPNVISSSEESEHEADIDTSGSCHGFSSSSETEDEMGFGLYDL